MLQMLGVQRLTTARRWSRFLACGLGYLLVLQGLMASIGLGMSASASEPPVEICTSYHAIGLQPSHNQKKSDHRPQCPFCLAAVQSCRHLAGPGFAAAHTSYGETRLLGVFHVVRNCQVSGFCLRRTAGDPRGPPQFSV
jgi:hypothetical protein